MFWWDHFRYSTWREFNTLISNLLTWRYLTFWYFSSAEKYNNALKSQYSQCNIWMIHNTIMIPITSLYIITITMLCIPSQWEKTHGLKQDQDSSLQGSICWLFSCYTSSWVEQHINFTYASLPHIRRNPCFFFLLKAVYMANWSSLLVQTEKTGQSLVPSVLSSSSFATGGTIPWILLWAVPVSSQPSCTVGVYMWVRQSYKWSMRYPQDLDITSRQ